MSLLRSITHPDAAEFSAVPCGGILAILNGLDRPYKYEPESKTVKYLGPLNPEEELSATPGAAFSPEQEPYLSPAYRASPGNLTGTFIYTFLEVDSRANQGQGTWSGPPRDSEGAVVTVLGDHVVIDFPLPINAETDEYWVYRSDDQGSWPTLGRIARVKIADRIYVDGGETPDFDNFPLDANVDTPPVKTYGMRMRKRLILWGNEPFTTTLEFVDGSTEAIYISGDQLDAGCIGMVIYPDDDTRGYLITDFIDGTPQTITFQDAYEGPASPSALHQECKIVRPDGEFAWSEPDHYTNFPLANVRFVELGSSDPESGCGVVNGRGLLFTVSKTFGLAFDITPADGWGEVVELSHSMGCLSHRTIQDCNAVLLWLTEGGIAASAGAAPRIVSDEIADQFDDVLREATGRVRKAFAINWRSKRKYICFVPVEGDTMGCSRAIVCDYKQVPGEPAFRFTIYNFNMEFTCGSLERHTVVSGSTVNYYEYPIVGDRYGYVWSFGVGDADGPDSGTVSGNITGVSTSPNILEDSGASFDITGIGLEGMPLTIEHATSGAEQHNIIASNTATQLQVRGTWDWTPNVGDIYRVGQIDAYYATGWLDFGIDNVNKNLHRLVTSFEPEDTGELSLDIFGDMSDTKKSLTEEGPNVDLSTAAGRVSRKLSGKAAFRWKFRWRNKNPDEPWKLRAASVELEPDEL